MNDSQDTVEIGVAHEVSDAELEALLHHVYVEGGFTAPDLATSQFSAAVVRARGDIIIARGGSNRELLGIIIVVAPTSPARRIAASDEAEVHLLAVGPQHRGRGLGSRLIEAAVAMAKRDGWKRMVLWTQPSMHSAQRLYTANGFVRAPERDHQIAKVTIERSSCSIDHCSQAMRLTSCSRNPRS